MLAKILCLFLLLLSGCARHTSEVVYPEPPQLASINIVDREGMMETISSKDRLKQYAQTDFLASQSYQKVLRIYVRDAEGDIHAILTTYHPNGQPKQYLEIVNNNAYGTFKEWHINGKLKTESFVIGGNPDVLPSAQKTWIFDGLAKVYKEDGQVEAEFVYEKGLLNCDAIYYHNNGKIWKQIPYQNNLPHGTMRVFREDGTTLQEVSFQQGEKCGNAVRFWCENQPASTEVYNRGSLVQASFFDRSGQEISTIKDGNGYRAVFGRDGLAELQEYQKGQQQGEIKVFAKNGQILRLYHSKNGKNHGEEIVYYPSGKPKLSITWYQGKIQGKTRTWYENGTMESQREMSENTKNGVSSAWYQNGNIMLLEEYEHNRLTKGDYFRQGERIPVSQVINGNGVATLFNPDGSQIRKIEYQNGHPAE